MMNRSLIIGTRGSKLALWQAGWVKTTLQKHHPGLEVELVIIKTKGDKILDVPLAKVGGKGLFVKEIEEALLDERIDLAVHSMKDMPADIPEGLCVGAVPEREDPRDVLISKEGAILDDLPEGSCVGTSSLRRVAQIRHARSDIVIKPLRGNLDTRMKKLETEGMDAIVLAAAGVRRLGFEERITEYLDVETVLPAVGQGALCIETRENDSHIDSIVNVLDHAETRLVVTGERAFSARLEGGCQVPIAALGRIMGDDFILSGLVADVEGEEIYKKTLTGKRNDPARTGSELAGHLMSLGAKEILEKLKADG